MNGSPIQNHRHRVGFVSMRFSGTDGVSLETEKWANVLAQMGHTCFYLTGESDRPPDRTRLVPEASFHHPQIESIESTAFDDSWWYRSTDRFAIDPTSPVAPAYYKRPV